jgi:hypothetical protein
MRDGGAVEVEWVSIAGPVGVLAPTSIASTDADLWPWLLYASSGRAGGVVAWMDS